MKGVGFRSMGCAGKQYNPFLNHVVLLLQNTGLYRSHTRTVLPVFELILSRNDSTVLEGVRLSRTLSGLKLHSGLLIYKRPKPGRRRMGST